MNIKKICQLVKSDPGLPCLALTQLFKVLFFFLITAPAYYGDRCSAIDFSNIWIRLASVAMILFGAIVIMTGQFDGIMGVIFKQPLLRKRWYYSYYGCCLIALVIYRGTKIFATSGIIFIIAFSLDYYTLRKEKW